MENNALNNLINSYAKKAERIYEERTAVDLTWNGFLAMFLIDAGVIMDQMREEENK